MRCDASELRFEALLEGTLAAREQVELDAHLERCARCRGILEELRVVDALLLAPRELEPPPNFTFKTMAEIRSMPAPRAARPVWPWLVGMYMILSWSAIAAWIAIARPDTRAAVALVTGFTAHLTGALDGIARVVGTGFGLGYAGVAGVVTFLLLLDLALLCAIVFLRSVVRPRLAAHLARGEVA
jgi:anti-sigma factor RsiW